MSRFSLARHVERQVLRGVAIGEARHFEAGRDRRAALSGDLRGGLGGALHRLRRELLDVGVAGGVALHDAHAEALADRLGLPP